MSALPARHLALVEIDENGEFKTVDNRELGELQAELEKLRVDLKMAQRDVKAKNRRISELEADKARDRLDHPERPKILRVHGYWQRRCETRGALTPVRFDAVLGIIEQQRIVVDAETGKKRSEPAYAYPDDFKRAIDGCWHDHFTKVRKNGSTQHFVDLELIHRDGKQFEEYMQRAPVSGRLRSMS